jgi:hypothetical protein
LLAKAQVDVIQYSKDGLRDLQRLEGSLFGIYSYMMKQIRSQSSADVQMANTVFLWSLYGRILLTSKQLQHAVAVTLGAIQISGSNLPDVEKLIAVCRGFVQLHRPSGTVGILHSTAHDFLVRTDLDKVYPTPHQTIAEHCRRYITRAGADAQLHNIEEPRPGHDRSENGSLL